MAVKANGFAKPASWADIPRASVFLAWYEQSTFVGVKILDPTEKEEPLLLGQLGGEPSRRRPPYWRPWRSLDFATLPGQVAVRPANGIFPLIDGAVPHGALLIDAAGGAHVRLSDANSIASYVSLQDGTWGSPEGERLFYPDWDLIHVPEPGREETLLAIRGDG